VLNPPIVMKTAFVESNNPTTVVRPPTNNRRIPGSSKSSSRLDKSQKLRFTRRIENDSQVPSKLPAIKLINSRNRFRIVPASA
jgi:hypothetical protein